MAVKLREIAAIGMAVIGLGGLSAMVGLGIWAGAVPLREESIYNFNYSGNPAKIIKRVEGPFREYYFSFGEDSLKGRLITDEGDTINVRSGKYGDRLYINKTQIK